MEELSVLSKGVKIVNTTKATAWAVKIFNDWKRATNERAKEVLVPENLFLCSNKEIITSILSHFFCGDKKKEWNSLPTKDPLSSCVWPATPYERMQFRLPHFFLIKKTTNLEPCIALWMRTSITCTPTVLAE